MMSYRGNGYEMKILKEMNNMFKEQCMVDCKLSAEGKYIKVHRVVLSSCSPYFKLLLSEEKSNEYIIILRGVAYNDLVNIVEFIYNGHVDVPVKEWMRFVSTAKHLQITELLELNEAAVSRSENTSGRFEETDNGRSAENPSCTFERDNFGIFSDVEGDALEIESTMKSSESDARTSTSVENWLQTYWVDESTVVDLETDHENEIEDSWPAWEQQNQRELEQVQSQRLSSVDPNKESGECHVVNSQLSFQGDGGGGGGGELDRSTEGMSPSAGMKRKRCETCNGEHKSSQNTVTKSMVSQSGMEASTLAIVSPSQAASGNQEVENRITEGCKNLKCETLHDVLRMDVCEKSNEAESETVRSVKFYKCKYLARAPTQVFPTHSVTKHLFSTPHKEQLNTEKEENLSKTVHNLIVRLVRVQPQDSSENPCFAVAPISREEREKAPGEPLGNGPVEEDPGPSPSCASAPKGEGSLPLGRKCSVCSRIFRGALQLSSHMLNHNPKGTLSHSRAVSGAASARKMIGPRHTKRRIKQNKRLCCEKQDQPSSSTGSYACGISKSKGCGKSFEEIHRSSHPFCCGECGVSFKQKISLIQHMLVHREKN